METRRAGKQAAMKRKRASGAKSVEQKADIRRSQNRLSQQEHRRKQNAYIRTMESFIEAIQDTGESQNEDTKYAKLLKAHTELIEENRRLKSLLHTTRRKLLGIIDQLDFPNESSVDQGHEAMDTPTASEPSPNSLALATNVRPVITTPNPNTDDLVAGSREGHDILISNSAGQSGNQVRPFEVHRDIGSELGTSLPFPIPDLAEAVEICRTMEVPLQGISSAYPNHGLDDQIFQDMPLYSQPWLFPAPTSRSTTLNSATIFAERIIRAAKKILTQFEGSAITGFTSLSDRTAYDVAPAAVQVMGSLAGLETYIYPTRFSTYLEDVIRWRISRSSIDFAAVPQPFRPTPLQCKSENHPVVIDFINWPSIRDQMINMYEHLDLDAMCRDIVLNTVVDLDRFGCSVNVHDLLFNYILPRVKGVDVGSGEQSMLHKSSWIYLQTEESDMVSGEAGSNDSADEALARQIATRMSFQYTSKSSILAALTSDANSAGDRGPPVDEWSLSALLSYFDIHDISRWRLGRDFARKYPFMDCSAVITKFETLSCRNEAFRSKITDLPIYTR